MIDMDIYIPFIDDNPIDPPVNVYIANWKDPPFCS
jgi:hypothetical protein